MATANDLHGTWHLEAWRTDYSDGREPTFPYGKDAQGTITYTTDGSMSASIMKAGRARLSVENTRLAPEGEKVLAFDSYFNYAGPFEVRGDVVVHKVRFALNPNFIGTDQVRKITLEPGKLTLSAEETDAKGVTRLHRLIWKR